MGVRFDILVVVAAEPLYSSPLEAFIAKMEILQGRKGPGKNRSWVCNLVKIFVMN